jgi:uncharacterized phage protein (TIGR01671 family)
MNQLKFRFWNKKEKGFVNSITSKGPMLYTYYIYISQFGELIAVNRSGNLDPVTDVIKLDDDDFDILQSTTLLDKNGKEIYVGDIVKGNLPEDETELIAPVAFSPQSGYFIDSRLNEWHSVMYEWCLNVGKDVEVIGNIFENPELINNPDL